MTGEGVKVNLHYIPVYRQPYYAQMGFKMNHCPNAEKYFKSSISIPVFSSLTPDQQQRVVELIQTHCSRKKEQRVMEALT